MNKEFVSYTQALALKELGFDEESFGHYRTYGKNLFYATPIARNLPARYRVINAPLFQQAFRFFREKHELYKAVYADKRTDDLTVLYKVHVYKLDEELSEYAYRWAKTYEEAESACLDKLIEIIKNK